MAEKRAQPLHQPADMNWNIVKKWVQTNLCCLATRGDRSPPSKFDFTSRWWFHNLLKLIFNKKIIYENCSATFSKQTSLQSNSNQTRKTGFIFASLTNHSCFQWLSLYFHKNRYNCTWFVHLWLSNITFIFSISSIKNLLMSVGLTMDFIHCRQVADARWPSELFLNLKLQED